MGEVKRPKLTSVYPPTKPGEKVRTGLCEICGNVQAFHAINCTGGYWTECRACQDYTHFFRIHAGRVVEKW